MKHASPKEIVVIGAGGHSKVVIDTLVALKFKIKGVVDRNQGLWKTTFCGHPVLGGDDAILALPPGEILLANGIGNVGKTSVRKNIFQFFKEKNYDFVSFVHPFSFVSLSVKIDEGAQIMAGAVVQAGTEIGLNTIVNTGARVDHDCLIGNHCHVAPGATLCGGVKLGDDSFVGAGSVINQYLSIGARTVIASGAAVTKHIEIDSCVGGVPARLLQKID